MPRQLLNPVVVSLNALMRLEDSLQGVPARIGNHAISITREVDVPTEYLARGIDQFGDLVTQPLIDGLVEELDSLRDAGQTVIFSTPKLRRGLHWCETHCNPRRGLAILLEMAACVDDPGMYKVRLVVNVAFEANRSSIRDNVLLDLLEYSLAEAA